MPPAEPALPPLEGGADQAQKAWVGVPKARTALEPLLRALIRPPSVRIPAPSTAWVAVRPLAGAREGARPNGLGIPALQLVSGVLSGSWAPPTPPAPLSLSFLIYKMGTEESIKGGYHLPGAAESVLY